MVMLKPWGFFRKVYILNMRFNSHFRSCVHLDDKLFTPAISSKDINEGHVLQNFPLRGNASLWIKHTSLVGYCSSVAPANVTYKELLILKEKKQIYLVDVREPAEIAETGKLPGSTHIPLGELKCALEALSAEEFRRKYGANKPELDAAVVFSCKAGVRSVAAMELAIKSGFKNSRSYGGGFMEWSENSKISCEQK